MADDTKRIMENMSKKDKKQMVEKEPVAEEKMRARDRKKDEKEGGGLSETFTAALTNFVPLAIGGLFEGSEGAVDAYKGAQQGMDKMQERNLNERGMQAREQQVEQMGDIAGARLAQGERGLDIREDAIRERRDANLARMRQQEQMFNRKQQADQINDQRDFQKKLALIQAKEQAKLQRKGVESNQEELKELSQAEKSGQDALNELLALKEKFENYSSNELLGTGPIATLGGTTQYVSEGTQDLQAAFAEAGLEKMSQMFEGMSRAIDSDAERRKFESAQPNLTNDDQVNRNLINKRIEAAQEALRKVVERKQELGVGLSGGSSSSGVNNPSELRRMIQQEKAARNGSK